MDGQARSPEEVLREAAGYYWEVAELDPDEVDPDDHVAVLRKAFTESDCDDFAFVLHAMTGWQAVRASYQIPDWGWGHHTMLRAPDGRLLDVRGYADEATAARRCCRSRGVVVTFADCDPREPDWLAEADEEGFSEGLRRIVAVVRSLPGTPFRSRSFREMSTRPLEGADVPFPERAADPVP